MDDVTTVAETSREPKSSTRRKKQPRIDPLEAAVTAFVEAFDTDSFAKRLLAELRIRGLDTPEALDNRSIRAVEAALRAALHADAAAFISAAKSITE